MTFFGAVKEHIAAYLTLFKDIAQTAYLLQKSLDVYRFARHRLVSLLNQFERARSDKRQRRLIRSLKRHLIAPIIAGKPRRERIYSDAKTPHYRKYASIRIRSFRADELEDAVFDMLKRYYPHPKDREVLLQRLLERVRLQG